MVLTPPLPGLVRVTEGQTPLWVPPTENVRGPKRREGVPFYNPAMAIARDVSVLVLGARSVQRTEPFRVFDAMAALGARGLRLAHEVPGTRVQLNDANPASIQLAQHNAKALGLNGVDFRVGRLESHLGAERYDWVDIDPFGTAGPYLDVGILGLEDDGILAVTATDTASLSGVYPAACRRRYNATPRRGACMPELALRILVGAIVRSAARRDRGARPLLAYATDHFVRAYVHVSGGPQAADAAYAQLGFARFGPDGEREVVPEASVGPDTAGPLWAGPLLDSDVAVAVQRRAEGSQAFPVTTRRLVDRLAQEVGSPVLYVDIDEVTRGTPHEAPPLENLVEDLRASGFAAHRTHFSPRGLKTTATLAELRRRVAGPIRRPA